MKHNEKIIHCMSGPIKSAKSQTVNWKNIYIYIYTEVRSIDMSLGVA